MGVDKSYICAECKERFTNEHMLAVHFKKHEK